MFQVELVNILNAACIPNIQVSLLMLNTKQ